MNPSRPLGLLGGLSPERFARRHWHRRPLLVRQALPGVTAPVSRTELFALAARDDVESRLIRQQGGGRWALRHGPLARRSLPAFSQPGWTVLVQGLDLHVQAAHELLARFRFMPDARLDDLMISWASDGGGVGPHFDSYDVFLLQVQGRRRWRVGRLADPALVPDVPLRILANFEAEQEWVLEPGDLLYLPPHWAHDGIAEGECMTCSVGYRAGTRASLAGELLQALADDLADEEDPAMARRYADPGQPASDAPARIPAALQGFAFDALQRLVADRPRLERALGERLSEPKPGVWFDAGEQADAGAGPGVGSRGAEDDTAAPLRVVLDRRTRMLYDDRHVFVNGESWRAAGADARLMRRLADRRELAPAEWARASDDARALLREWQDAGWLRLERPLAVAGGRELENPPAVAGGRRRRPDR